MARRKDTTPAVPVDPREEVYTEFMRLHPELERADAQEEKDRHFNNLLHSFVYFLQLPKNTQREITEEMKRVLSPSEIDELRELSKWIDEVKLPEFNGYYGKKQD